MENLLLLGLVRSTPPSSIFEVSFDPCRKGFNFPSFFDTDEKNVGLLEEGSPFAGVDDDVPRPLVFLMSEMYIFIFISSERNASFSLISVTSVCNWVRVVTASGPVLESSTPLLNFS